jgi:hypothetical protein
VSRGKKVGLAAVEDEEDSLTRGFFGNSQCAPLVRIGTSALRVRALRLCLLHVTAEQRARGNHDSI